MTVKEQLRRAYIAFEFLAMLVYDDIKRCASREVLSVAKMITGRLARFACEGHVCKNG